MSLAYDTGDFSGSRPNNGQIWASAVDLHLDGFAQGDVASTEEIQALLAEMPGRTDCIQVLSTLGIEVGFSPGDGFRVWRGQEPEPVGMEDYIDEAPKFFSY